MSKPGDSIALAELRVAEARTAALAEYEAARADLRRRMSSPVFIGGVLLGVIALGYFTLGRGKRSARAEGSAASSGLVKTMQVLLPLWIALGSATKAARKPGTGISRTAG